MGIFWVFFVHGNMMDLSSGNLTACRLPLKEYAAYAFIWKWYIPYIPQNGNFSRVDDDKELDLGGHQYPELIDLWSWSSIELIYDKAYDDPIYNLCHFPILCGIETLTEPKWYRVSPVTSLESRYPVMGTNGNTKITLNKTIHFRGPIILTPSHWVTSPKKITDRLLCSVRNRSPQGYKGDGGDVVVHVGNLGGHWLGCCVIQRI